MNHTPVVPENLVAISRAETARYAFDPDMTNTIKLPGKIDGILAVGRWKLLPGLFIASPIPQQPNYSGMFWSDEIPRVNNDNGIKTYALSAYHLATTGFGCDSVIGMADITGKILAHPDGALRAECCRLVLLMAHHTLSPRLSRIYGLPCISVCCGVEAASKLADWLSEPAGIDWLKRNHQLSDNLKAKALLEEMDLPVQDCFDSSLVLQGPAKTRVGDSVTQDKPATALQVFTKTVPSCYEASRRLSFQGDGIIVKNESLQLKYKRGVSGFTNKHSCLHNAGLTIVMGESSPVFTDLLKKGFEIGEDFVLLNAHRYYSSDKVSEWTPEVAWLKAEITEHRRHISLI